ncbi:hypothetical protein [Nakamurella sp. PAMC28650]|uniref:hypothetical protein n=1 Tax=Nakamurella sp. PAMC28650 TaxID=2762325 RepID=UPI00164D13E6|nr:hypothetical protein [Nakamurella sp. PAMC28650]QNK81538.1 hypothetical protein H7F38_01430 [Nakamurella sp. PAMC28650]
MFVPLEFVPLEFVPLEVLREVGPEHPIVDATTRSAAIAAATRLRRCGAVVRPCPTMSALPLPWLPLSLRTAASNSADETGRSLLHVAQEFRCPHPSSACERGRRDTARL